MIFAKAMKLKGQHSLALAGGTVFIICARDGCSRCFLRQQLDNVSKICKLFKDRPKNENDMQHEKKPEETCELHLTAKLISATFITRRFLSVLQTSNMIDIF